MGQCLYVNIFYSLILEANIVIYLSFVIIIGNWQSFKIDSSYIQTNVMKTVHFTTLLTNRSTGSSKMLGKKVLYTVTQQIKTIFYEFQFKLWLCALQSKFKKDIKISQMCSLFFLIVLKIPTCTRKSCLCIQTRQFKTSLYLKPTVSMSIL